MTFSDAEEDQPSVMQSGNMSNGISDSSRGSSSIEGSNTDATQAGCDEQAAYSSNNDQASSNDQPVVNGHDTPTTGTVTESSTNANGDSNTTSGSQDSEPSGISPSQSSHLEHNSVNDSSSQASLQYNADSVVGAANNIKGLGTEKVMEKLQQIHGYIQQTAAAMEALEREGDLNKIGQYNTLVKCMRDLKKSEMNLTSHLTKIKERPPKSLPESGTSGSESIGVVGDMNGSSGYSSTSMEERLARHETEQQLLSERLRESLVRREELMARYQATRERLNNLKRQRLGLVQEERKLLQSVGAPDNMYENPIPGAESWTIEQLESATRDFHGLKEKVERLLEAYTSKLEGMDNQDTEARTELQRKIDQLVCKRTQIDLAISQMGSILQIKREAGNGEGSVASGEGTSINNPSSDDISVNPGHSERAPSEDEIRTPVESGNVEGASGANPDALEMQHKRQHLQSLKDQLLSMKKLLHVTQDSLPQGNEEGTNPMDDDDEQPLISNAYEEEERPLIESTIVGVNGEVIHLSESERRNPEVVSKYRQLSEAKQRLAKMEEIMMKIAEARDSGRSLSDVLSPENLAILNEARSEEEQKSLGRERSSSRLNEGREPSNSLERTSDNLGTSNESLTLLRRTNRDLEMTSNPKVNENCKKAENPSDGKNKWEREREISAMQSHFKKKTSGIPSVNEGSKSGNEKGAIKKQTRELLNERGNDPRLMEVAALQEELKEKKNALEALMRRMGKSSSFAVDNISDNISENVSDLNSEIFEKPLASWGPQARYYSDPCQSEEELVDTNEEELDLNFGTSQAPLPPRRKVEPPFVPSSAATNAKNRNRFPPKPHDHPEPNRFSVNNLSNNLPKSVRPKQNRAAPGPVPVTSWENVTNSNPTSVNSNPNPNSNPNSKVQNTVAAALSQLSQVQDTINSLYGDLRAAELSTRQQPEIPAYNPYGNPAVAPPIPYLLPQTYVPPNYCVSPLPTTQGRGDLGASNHILAGLQQCFSQLYLHSLEIQSLSKHIQVRPTNMYPYYPFLNYFFQPPPPPTL